MSSPFKVSYLKSVKDRTQQEYVRFRERGKAAEFADAAATVDRELRSNPREFGDPCYSLAKSELDVFVRAVRPLLIHYGVHQVEPIVIVFSLDVFGE